MTKMLALSFYIEKRLPRASHESREVKPREQVAVLSYNRVQH